MSKNYVRLNTGNIMPLLGLGTFKIRGQEVVNTVLNAALTFGYRSIDTASAYQNEKYIAKSLEDLLPLHKLKREDIFITSKLAPSDQGAGTCREACLKSIARLNCSYLDLFLIHWPSTQKLRPEDPRNKSNRLGSWSDMEQLFREGKVKAIGVANFLEHHLEELIESSNITPAVLQIEFHPHLVQDKLLEWCQRHGIHFQAYSSLGTSAVENKLLGDPTVKAVAARVNKTPAQVLLRWAVQQGVGVLPKSVNIQHLKENAEIFDFTLPEEEMVCLSGLHSETHYCWNPSMVV